MIMETEAALVILKVWSLICFFAGMALMYSLITLIKALQNITKSRDEYMDSLDDKELRRYIEFRRKIR
jgi:hypothetical protein